MYWNQISVYMCDLTNEFQIHFNHDKVEDSPTIWVSVTVEKGVRGRDL